MEEIRKAGKIKPFDVIDVLIMILFILIMAYPPVVYCGGRI